MDAIKIENLTKYYGKARGIREIDLTVAEGEFFGFIGPNGAGKSTTIRTLLGLIAPASGRAYIFGLDIVKQNKEILARVGYLPSEAVFYSGMRVGEVLKLSADLRGKDCGEEAVRLCERLQLDTSRKVEELSFGNRKKVGIVCALQHEPALLILDEPTSGLDPLMQREFYAILEERSKNGATIFVSSHILSEVQRYCRHAAIIREGRLLALDSTKKLGHTDTKRVRLRGAGRISDRLSSLLNLKDLQIDGDSVSFLYSGSLKELLNTLAALPLSDASITEPDLEEIFMHYYG